MSRSALRPLTKSRGGLPPHRPFRRPSGSSASGPLSDIRDADLRAGLVKLFDDAQSRVDRGQVQAVILAARRLACIYQLLVATKAMHPIDGAVVISDRSIELALDTGMTGVLILDDSVVLGTTLDRLKAQVHARCPSADVATSCVVVDRDQQIEYLTSTLGLSYLHCRPTEDVQRFSADIVRCLYRHQIPFVSDFPISVPLKISTAKWIEYLKEPSWLVAEVTPPLLEETETQALTHIGGEAVSKDFLTRVLPEVAELIDIAKVRSFSRKTWSRQEKIVLVPMVLLAPASAEDLRQCMRSIMAASCADESANDQSKSTPSLGWESWDSATQQRFVQYYASCCLLATFHGRFGSDVIVDDSSDSLLDLQAVQLLFGAKAIDALAVLEGAVSSFGRTPPGHFEEPARLRILRPRKSPVLSDERLEILLFSTREMILGTGLPPRPETGELTKVGLIFGHGLAAIFGYIDSTLESAQRAQIKAMSGRSEYEDWVASGPGRILNQGITLAELTTVLLPGTGHADDPWLQSLVALGLDVGNDLGIIVPVTKHDSVRGLTFRSYRLGETAYLAGRPLPLLIAEDDRIDADDLDAMAHSIDRQSLEPIVKAIDESVRAPRPPKSSSFDERLQLLNSALLNVVPGALVEGWNGEVSHVLEDSDEFEAELEPIHQADAVVARLPLDWVADDQRDQVRPGMQFVWTIWERSAGHSKVRSSKVDFLPQRTFNPAKVMRIGSRLADQYNS